MRAHRIGWMVLAATIAASSSAAAQRAAGDAGLLAPSTRAGFAHGALGFTAGDGGAGFSLVAAGGYHFSSTSAGPALSGELQVNIAGGASVLPGARFAWDIPIGNLPLYLSPSVRLGALIVPDSGIGETVAFFDVQPAFDVKLVLGDRGLLFARPVGVDIYLGNSVGAAYQFLVGGGATF